MATAQKKPKKKSKIRGGGGALPRHLTTRMHLRDLVPADYNPRVISNAAKQGLSSSLKKFGQVQSIVWNKRSKNIVGGHQRVDQLLSLNENEADVTVVDLDDVDEKALNLALNNPEIQGEFSDNVHAVLEQIREGNAKLYTGLRLDKMREGLLEAAAGSGPKGDGPSGQDAPEPKLSLVEELLAKWATKLGQIWEVGPHRIMCGDSRDHATFRRLFGEERAKWSWTDPPYGVSYVGKTEDALEIENDGAEGLPELLRGYMSAIDTVLEDGAPIYVAHPAGPLSFEFMHAFRHQGWHLHETLIWVKDSMVLGRCDYHYKHEPVLYGWKKGRARFWYGGRDKVSVQEIPRPKRSEEHPTMKPVKLVETHLGNSSLRGDLGVEPFGGSGTTMCAAHLMGRRCYSVELDPRFVAVELERMAEMGLAPRLLSEAA